MSSARGGGRVRSRLRKQKKVQEILEVGFLPANQAHNTKGLQTKQKKTRQAEQARLEKAGKPEDSCKAIIAFIEKHEETIGEEGNPFLEKPNNCFIAGTKILTSSNKEIEIQNLKVGDKILTIVPNDKMNETIVCEKGKMIRKEGVVLYRWERVVYETVVIKIDITGEDREEDLLIETTLEHPFYVPSFGKETSPAK